MAEKGGVDRTHSSAIPQKATFWGLHFLIILFCSWLVLGEGGVFLERWGIRFSDLTRPHMLLACAVIYFLRHGLTLFYLLVRRVEWGEVLGLSTFFALFEIGLILVGGGVFRDASVSLSALDLFAVALYLCGSYLNTASEVQRKLWKADPSNRGRCYTSGLFRYSMHINYFGDVVLFTGWCLLTASLWTLGLPLMMLLLFMYVHIPPLDDYLAQRYGEEFKAYRANTSRLIPFVW